jgi:hypothetical protein
MSGQPSDKSFEQEKIKMIEYHIKELGGAVIKIAKTAEEMADLEIEIGRLDTIIKLNCNKSGYDPTWCKYNFSISIFDKISDKDIAAECYSKDPYPPYKFECFDYFRRSFKDLSEIPEIFSLLEHTKYSLLSTRNILSPGIFTKNNQPKQYIEMITKGSIHPKNSINKNPEIRIYDDKITYIDNIVNVEITWRYHYIPF